MAAACRARAAALAAGRGSTGAAPGSPAETADRAAVSALADRGLRYSGLRLDPRSVRLVTSSADRAVVDVVVASSRYQVVDHAGRVVQEVAAVPDAAARLDLVRTSGGWRVSQVRSA